MTSDPKKEFNLKRIHDEITKEIEISYPRIIINNGIPTRVLSDEQEMLIRSRIFKRKLHLLPPHQKKLKRKFQKRKPLIHYLRNYRND